MDFPKYVPEAVRHYLSAATDGQYGLASALKSAEAALSEIEFQIESCTRWGKDDYLPGLAVDKLRAKEHRDRLFDDWNYLHRLAHDMRMKPTFEGLAREPITDAQWRAFIEASRVARDDFGRYRDQLQRAKALTAKIAASANELAGLLGNFAGVGLVGPDAFFSIPALLRQTDNPSERNRHMWQSMRGDILGDLETHGQPDLATVDAGPVEVVLTPMGNAKTDDIEQENADTMRYAWTSAPPVQSLLTTLSQVARDFKPDAPSEISAAALSRQRARVPEYLRAFWHILKAKGFTLTSVMERAIAITATVALNDPNIEVSADSVRKALRKLKR